MKQVEAEALKLAPADRAKLARTLLESLDSLSAEENLESWAAEAEARDSQAGSDASQFLPAGDILRSLRAKHR